MSGPVDVLAVLRNSAAWMPNAVYVQEMREASAAIAELIEAARDLQEAMDEHEVNAFDIGPSKRFIAADARHRAALAAIGATP